MKLITTLNEIVYNPGEGWPVEKGKVKKFYRAVEPDLYKGKPPELLPAYQKASLDFNSLVKKGYKPKNLGMKRTSPKVNFWHSDKSKINFKGCCAKHGCCDWVIDLGATSDAGYEFKLPTSMSGQQEYPAKAHRCCKDHTQKCCNPMVY